MADKVPTSRKQPLIRKGWIYLNRTTRLRCPECGISPLFPPARRVESISDWFTMLPGCPRCGYAYDREPGYFLFALWMINFAIVAFVGIGLLFLLDSYFDLSTAQLLFFTLVPLWGLGILSTRHTKAFFLALDHLLSPHLKDPD
ncbi:MAG: hypothetical protein BroJett011_51060 [Chloroflexota bacterium]|nr:MAG: hypothetical protein BroJett011_51060 [Chloroflexota bacterium]